MSGSQPSADGSARQHKWPSVTTFLFGFAGLGFFVHLMSTGSLKPVSTLLLTALWEGFVGIFSKVWDRIEKRIVDIVYKPIDDYIRVTTESYGYRKRYLSHLKDRYLYADVKGLGVENIFSLKAERVYVELSVDPSLLTPATYNPVPQAQPVPQSLSTGRHSVWNFLASSELHNLAIIGAPGSGKTTLLKHITLALAAGHGRAHGLAYLPILLFVRDHSDSIGVNNNSSHKLTIDTIIDDSASTMMGVKPPEGWFKQQLARGSCLVMLDGLDEVANPTVRGKVAAWVEDQMKAFAANRFIVTSRPFGYKSNPLQGVTVLGVRPFDLTQIKQFVHRWYLANESAAANEENEAVRISAREASDKLLERLRDKPALLELAVNPLLLTMITTVHRYRGSLPGRRVELYAEICDAFLGRRQQARGIHLDLTPAQKKSVLQPLAFEMMHREKRQMSLSEASTVIEPSLALVQPELTCEEFLQQTQNSSGLLLERENGIYSFAHLTFQEYLTATHIVENQLQSSLLSKVNTPWWHETIRLYAALGDGSRLIDACLYGTERSLITLTLAIDCVAEARTVEPRLRRSVNSIIVDGVEDADPERRRIAAQAMLNLRLRDMIRLNNEDEFIDGKLINHAEYQYFLDSQRLSGIWRQPDHWKTLQFERGKANDAVLGVRFKGALSFCQWLNERDSGEWHYQPPDSNVSDEARVWRLDGTVANDSYVDYEVTTELLKERRSSDHALLNRGQLRLWKAFGGGIEGELDRFFDVKHSLVFANICPSVIDLDREADNVFAVDRDEQLDIDRAYRLDRERNLSRARNLDKTLDLDFHNLFHFFDRQQKEDREVLKRFDRLQDFGRIYDRGSLSAPIDWGRKLIHTLKEHRSLESHVDFGFVFGGTIDLALNPTRDPSGDLALTRAAFRILAMYLISKLSRSQDEAETSWFQRRMLQDVNGIAQRLRDAFCRAYLSLVILEERYDGRLLPTEGIRLMRKRKATAWRGLAA